MAFNFVRGQNYFEVQSHKKLSSSMLLYVKYRGTHKTVAFTSAGIKKSFRSPVATILR